MIRSVKSKDNCSTVHTQMFNHWPMNSWESTMYTHIPFLYSLKLQELLRSHNGEILMLKNTLKSSTKLQALRANLAESTIICTTLMMVSMPSRAYQLPFQNTLEDFTTMITLEISQALKLTEEMTMYTSHSNLVSQYLVNGKPIGTKATIFLPDIIFSKKKIIWKSLCWTLHFYTTMMMS